MGQAAPHWATLLTISSVQDPWLGSRGWRRRGHRKGCPELDLWHLKEGSAGGLQCALHRWQGGLASAPHRL